MSEQTIQEKLEDLLEALSEFSANSVTIGDYDRVLDAGYDRVAVITSGSVSPGADAELPGETIWRPGAGFELEWVEYIDIFQRWQHDGTSWTDFRDVRQSVINMLLAYPTLDNLAGVTYCRFGRGRQTEEPEPLYDRNGNGPFWIAQRLAVEVGEMVVQTTGEYA